MMGKRVGFSLNARKVETLTEAGMHYDRDGLYLRIGKNSGRSWILRTVVYGKRRDFGLGSARLVTLAEARDKAHEMRKVARNGGNPETLRRPDCLTFEEAARRTFDAHKPKWSSVKHQKNWWRSLEQYAFPSLQRMPLDQIQTRDVHRILEPIWVQKYDTAKTLKQRMSLVFDWAKGSGLYHRENPLNGLTKALPVAKPSGKHHPAMKWEDLPDFMRRLSLRKGNSARMMEFGILTCARSGEVRGALWEEIDGDLWTVGAARMKTRKPHRVPLSSDCVRILRKVKNLDDRFIFPSPTPTRDGTARAASDQVFNALLRRMGVDDVTMHGFRSTFKDWCNEYQKADWDVSEKALAHTVGNEVERAYARSDLLERRADLMESWACFALSKCGKKKRIKSRPKWLNPKHEK